MEKFERARQILVDLGLDRWLITSNEDSDIHSPYFLGVKSHARHFILLDSCGNHEVLAVPMEAPMIKKHLESTLEPGSGAVSVSSYSSSSAMIRWLKRVLDKPRVAVNTGERSLLSSTGFADYMRAGVLESLKEISPGTEFVSASDLIYRMRASKVPAEIRALEKAVKITQEVLMDVPNWGVVGMTEKEVKAKIEYEYLKVGEVSFDTIVASCEHSADPHHNSSGKKISRGVLLIDTGVRVDGITSDITWTFNAGGEPSEKFTAAYEALIEAKKISNKFMISGEKMVTPARKCREYLESRGYDHEKLFNHGLGHAIGYEVHDIGPRMSWKTHGDARFPRDSIYSNEPGLYWQGDFGIRIEDDIVVKAGAPVQVSSAPGDPIII
ncbi:MAG: M24 family metallopeptidase [Promethearchaeota archaeon]